MTANSASAPKIGVVVVAYNAASTLAGVLDRIPSSMRARIAEVIVSDDSSSDATYLVGLGYKQLCRDLPLTVIRNERNLGYGGNQKACYRLAIAHGLDIVVLLHGDGQYAPEYLPQMVAPLERGECDAVFGSRMLEPGAARRGGMPLYKYVGNKILTRVENSVLGMNLSEFHSGYRAYSVRALAELDLSSTSDGFDFDTEIIIMLHDRQMSIREIPIPTYYGDEICYVNGLAYARDVVADVIRYRLTRAMRTPTHSRATHPGADQQAHEGTDNFFAATHRRLSSHLAVRRPSRILDLAHLDECLAQAIQSHGHEVIRLPCARPPGTEHDVVRCVSDVLDDRPSQTLHGHFDVVLAADALERAPDPDLMLGQLRDLLASHGQLVASVSSFSHWYRRLCAIMGELDVANSSPHTQGRACFFTRRTFERMAAGAGMRVDSVEPFGFPFDRVATGRSRAVSALSSIDRLLAQLFPWLFAYEYLFYLSTQPDADVKHVEPPPRTSDAPPTAALPSPVLGTLA